MRNDSFGKKEDYPIQKKNVEDFKEDDMDLDEDIESDKKEIKTPNSTFKEYKLNPNDSNNNKIIFSSESEDEDNDSDKSSSISGQIENDKDKENNFEIKKNKEEKENNEKNGNKIIKKRDSYESFDKKIKKDKEIEDILLNSIKNKENATSQKIQMAEKINFKGIPDKIISTDQYGFIIEDDKNNNDIQNRNSVNERTKSGAELLQINARMEKWNYMLEYYDDFKTKNYRKLKSRTRKGIPDNLRSYVWQLFGEKDKYYEKDLLTKLESIPMNEDTDIVIIKDLDRTFPACQFFKEKYGNGQRKLYKVLSSYSKYNTNTGYVQGMGFIVALFLTYMDEESSFFMLHSLMKKYGLEGFYKPNFPKLKSTFYVLLNLLKKFVPKLYELFQKEGMLPSMYGSEWFICLFSRNLAFNTLVRIFDVFLLEGYKVIYRFALAFLKLKEDKFLQGKDGLGSIMETLNECYEVFDIENLFKVAFGFSISRKDIEKLEEEYEKIKNDKKNEFVKQL